MKKICSFIVVISLILLMVSCHNVQQPAVVSTSTDTAAANPMNKYTLDMVNNKKDFNCGMPLSAGIGDTAHYKGKVYGFCSKECKDAFLAKPDSFLQVNNKP